MPRPLAALLYEARMALDVGSQGKLGELLGSSQRSGQRWERGESTPAHDQLFQLAALVFPKDAALAAEVAAAGGSTLEKLGLVRPPPPAPPPVAPPPPDPIHIVDTVVCAAAEAMQLVPDQIRPALRAAFRRARLAGLTVEAVERALEGQSAPGGEAQSTPKKLRARAAPTAGPR